MSLQNLSKSAVRIGKNYIKGYTDTQIKIREATSNDPWGPSGSQLNELSQLSHNPTDFIEMMEILDKRLNDKGKNWRHVFKALSVLDYLLHAGSDSVWNYFHDNIYIVKTLKEFQYIDDSNIDQGINVRQKAKDITALLLDESRMRQRRRMRMEDETRRRDPNDFSDEAGRRRRQQREQERISAEDRELEQALAESRRMAEEEEARRRREAEDESNLQQALAASREEEEKRKKNETLIDLDKDEGPSTMQPQYTSFIPFQPTGFNPFFQAQMQQQYMQQQEYQRQLALQQAAQQYQYMMTQQQQQQQQAMMQQQPTGFGSNNPWLAQTASTPTTPASQPQPQPQPEPEPSALASDTLINLEGPEDPEPLIKTKPKVQGPPRVKVSNMNPELDRLLASGDGIDTFGNTGDMRLGPNAAMWHQAMQQQRTGADGAKSLSNPFAK